MYTYTQAFYLPSNSIDEHDIATFYFKKIIPFSLRVNSNENNDRM